MGRAPDRAVTRKHSITTRMDDNELRDLDAGGSARGGMDRSTYLRWLVAQDKRRIANERTIGRVIAPVVGVSP